MVMGKIVNTNQKVDLKTYGENHDAIFKKDCGKCVHFCSYAQYYNDPDEDSDLGVCEFDPDDLNQTTPLDVCTNFKRRSEK